MSTDPFSINPQLQGSLRRPRPLFLIAGLLLAVYLLVPMLIVIPASFTAGEFLEVPPDGLSLRWYDEVFKDARWIQALSTSLQVSGIGALVATVVATLAVIGLSRSRIAAKWLRPVFFLPMVLPIIVLALGIGQAVRSAHLPATLWPLVAGQAVLCIPIAFVAISAGMSNIDPALVRAAQSMGSSWWRTMARVELPLLKRSIITGLLLAFAFGFDEVVLALFLAPPGQTTLPARLYVEATQEVSPLLASVSGLIIALTVIVAVVALSVAALTKGRMKRISAVRNTERKVPQS